MSKKNLGFVFGLKPVSRISYSVEQFTKNGIDSLQTVYQGSGGLNEVFAGLGKKWKNFSVGFNGGYHFGKKDISTKVNFLNDSVHFKSSSSGSITYFNGFFINAGLQYNIKLSERINQDQNRRYLCIAHWSSG